MALDQKAIINQIDTLLERYESGRKEAKYHDLSDLPNEEAYALLTLMNAAVDRLAPAGSTYDEEAKTLEGNELGTQLNFLAGILRALKSDYLAGNSPPLFQPDGERVGLVSDERDHLTQLLNRAAFDDDLQTHFQQATAERPAGLIFGDIDYFKKINDCNGHPAGDAVLKELARRMRQAVGGKGFAYRYGGEEFAVVLPNHTAGESLAVAERVRRSVEAEAVGTVSVTISYGVAVVPMQATTTDQWLKNADDALYDAKHLGRNLVRLFGEPPPEVPTAREPLRKQAEPGVLSAELKERMRMQILREGYTLCPSDQVPLDAHDVTTFGEAGRTFLVQCAGCGLSTVLPGPGRIIDDE